MAPLLKIIVQWLPSLPNTLRSLSHEESIEIQPSFEAKQQQQQQPIGLQTSHNPNRNKPTDDIVSSVSWAKTHLDIFGRVGNNLTHKFWDGHQWNPADSETAETLGQGLATPPVAVTWGVGYLAVFGLDGDNMIKHQYWDGTTWKPSSSEFETLGGQCNPEYNIAASTWGPGRLDVFCRRFDGRLLHQYYDGSQWSHVEDFGGYLTTGPQVVSWGKKRIDVFFLDHSYQLYHFGWDGSQWSDQWDMFESPKDYKWDTLTVISWGENRLDVFAAEGKSGLWHMYWDGSQWVNWECLSGPDDESVGGVGVASWSVNRAATRAITSYKYFDGQSWQPNTSGWYEKTLDFGFSSNPSVVSWGENRLDIIGQTESGRWLHQAWTGDSWYLDSTAWESLKGGVYGAASLAATKVVKIKFSY
ncbi:MAG: hypothetical protein Q9210_005074 [Variospora velana]